MPGYENSAGISVNNFYGPRDTVYGSVGVEQSNDSIHQLSIAFTGTSLNSAYLPPVVVPKGAQFKRAILRVDEAFAVSAGGTVTFGGTAPGTNGIVLSETELENIGTKTPASSGTGTWAQSSSTGTTAAEKVTRSVSGTVTAGQGKATLILEFVNKTKV